MTRQEVIAEVNKFVILSDEFISVSKDANSISMKLRDIRWALAEQKINLAKDKFFNLVLHTLTSSDEERAFLDMIQEDLTKPFESM